MLVEIKNLKSYFFLDEGVLKAVDDVSFAIDERETVALVGESGCARPLSRCPFSISSPRLVVSWTGKCFSWARTCAR